MILSACEHSQLNRVCKVVSETETSGDLNVKLPKTLFGYTLYDFLDLSIPPYRTVSFTNVKFDCCHPWVDVPWKSMDRTAGYHLYKLSFMNKHVNSYVTFYFSYIIQDNNVHKSFLYMKNRYNEYDETKYGNYVSF